MERRRESTGPALPVAIRPPVGQVLPRPSLREERQRRHPSRYGEISLSAVRRPWKQSGHGEIDVETAGEVDATDRLVGQPEFLGGREFPGVDLSQSAAPG